MHAHIIASVLNLILGLSLLQWPGYKIKPKKIKPQSISLSQMTRGELLVQVARLLRSWMMEMKKEPSTDPNFAIRGEEDLRGLFITSLVHLGGSDWQVHLWAKKSACHFCD